MSAITLLSAQRHSQRERPIIYHAIEEIDRVRNPFTRLNAKLFLTFHRVRSIDPHPMSWLGLLNRLRLVPLTS